jgi:hypothetical protein
MIFCGQEIVDRDTMYGMLLRPASDPVLVCPLRSDPT